jgi:hypothetical protein
MKRRIIQTLTGVALVALAASLIGAAGSVAAQDAGQERPEYKPAVLEVVTNFAKADITVNGMPYPEYRQENEEPGMVLPAGGPHIVVVSYEGKKKTYRVTLRPYEHKVLMVELTGYKGGSVSRSPSASDRNRNTNKPKEDGEGRVTVYSKPKGQIHVNGNPRKTNTPGTISVPAGRHDIQVEFSEGEMSESKSIRIRDGSRIKLFFRKK